MDIQAPTIVAPLPLSAPTLTPLTIATISTIPQAPTPLTTAPSTLLQDLPNFGLLFGFDHRLKTLEGNFSEFMQTNLFAGAVSSIPGIIQRDMDQRINEAVKLKKILIEKMEGNKSIHRSDEQRNLYKALVEAYESDKIILDTYGDIVTLKRRRDDDANKDEEPSAGSDWGPRDEEKERSQSQQALQRRKLLRPMASLHKGLNLDKHLQANCDWNKTLPATHESIQPCIRELAKQTDSRSSFNELMDTLVDFSAFLMNRLKVDTLTHKLLVGPTYELMKGSCKSLVELEFFLDEVYKATTDQLDLSNPKGQQYPHNLLKPLPLIPNSQGRRVISFNHFINNDLEYLRGGASSRMYTTSVTKTKASDYGHIKWIKDLVPCTMWIQEPVGYDKHALWGISHWGANVKSSTDLLSTGIMLAMSTLNVESSLSLNLRLLSGTLTSIWIGSRDGTLNDVRIALDDRLKGIQMKYLPQTIWRKSDKERAAAMIQAIDKQLKTRRIIRSLERFSISIGETVTHWFTLIVMSALRRSDNENMLSLMNLILMFNFPHMEKILPVGIHLRQVLGLLGTTLSTLEVLEELVLKILRAITLTVCTTFDSHVKGAEFEVNGLDKALVLSTLGRTEDFGKGFVLNKGLLDKVVVRLRMLYVEIHFVALWLDYRLISQRKTHKRTDIQIYTYILALKEGIHRGFLNLLSSIVIYLLHAIMRAVTKEAQSKFIELSLKMLIPLSRDETVVLHCKISSPSTTVGRVSYFVYLIIQIIHKNVVKKIRRGIRDQFYSRKYGNQIATTMYEVTLELERKGTPEPQQDSNKAHIWNVKQQRRNAENNSVKNEQKTYKNDGNSDTLGTELLVSLLMIDPRTNTSTLLAGFCMQRRWELLQLP
uniref:Uncharacterized protein n=1 Tax=Tanacetum cinerariifolium TaxID=118510 RepID=A0A6L2LQC3_TANCI|nr:hypothetical protein [Tanacetum cinerariifolium]